jgi:hypothetical protein
MAHLPMSELFTGKCHFRVGWNKPQGFLRYFMYDESVRIFYLSRRSACSTFYYRAVPHGWPPGGAFRDFPGFRRWKRFRAANPATLKTVSIKSTCRD